MERMVAFSALDSTVVFNMSAVCLHPIDWYVLQTEDFGWVEVCAMCGAIRDPKTKQILDAGNPQRARMVARDRSEEIGRLTDFFLDRLIEYRKNRTLLSLNKMNAAADALRKVDPTFQFNPETVRKV